MHPATLLLADGTRFEGEGLAATGIALGEAVFYTGMTGYEEAITDPSYAGQILTFTYPLIGNYGVSGTASQHPHPCVAGAVIKHLARKPSHYAAKSDLGSWLDQYGVRTIVGIDTRALTIALREHGTIAAALAVGEEAIANVEAELTRYAREATTQGLVASVADAYTAGETIGTGRKHVVLLDCGVKRAIIRELTALDTRVTVLPYTATSAQVLAEKPDGVVVSPGPGDPQDLEGTVETLRGLIGKMPIFGVCLGHQMLALACGAQTYKLPYGHRGGNQPVKDLVHDEVLVTAHNHGYAVDGASLPADLEPTMVNLNDGTNEGFRHRTLAVEAVQFHPEASPGPFDARALFARWLDRIE
ncbi:MAG TPA: glutamine-hydrolyzing carbamoyl-phosphate synthase small subunit [Candidatus Limnocylindria bacterium]|jgi:carbamoyl-phosphate synthase small subunit|nr:glutamine-hydrolyzing carbamoyl-phosphate synthase small subunit [Candidatus Limnocylindria bacterium]